MRMSRFAKLAIAAGLFVVAMASSRNSFAACSYACEQDCAAAFDRCVDRSGGWTQECQNRYDGCAFRCGC